MKIRKSKETNCTSNVGSILDFCSAFFSQFIAPYKRDCVLSLPCTRRSVNRHRTSSSTSTRRGRMVCWTSKSSRSIDLNFRLASHQKLPTLLRCTTTRTFSAEWFTVDCRGVHGSDNRQLKIAPFNHCKQ